MAGEFTLAEADKAEESDEDDGDATIAADPLSDTVDREEDEDDDCTMMGNVAATIDQPSGDKFAPTIDQAPQTVDKEAATVDQPAKKQKGKFKSLFKTKTKDALAALLDVVEAQLSDLDRLVEAAEAERIANICLEMEQKFQLAVQTYEDGTDDVKAQSLLTEMVTALQDESTLEDLRGGFETMEIG